MLRGAYNGDDGRRHFLFGLSDGNLERLRNGQPILIDLGELGGRDGTVLIFTGRTEEKMVDMLRQRGLIGPETRIRDEKGGLRD